MPEPYPPRAIVWGNYNGQNWWPAQVMKVEEFPKGTSRQLKGKVCVKFLGSSKGSSVPEVACLKPSEVLSYEKHDQDLIKQVFTDKREIVKFEAAIILAKESLKKGTMELKKTYFRKGRGSRKKETNKDNNCDEELKTVVTDEQQDVGRKRRKQTHNPNPSFDSSTKLHSKTSPSKRARLGKHYFECVVCDLGGNLLCCDQCPRTYHLQCLKPALKRTPLGKWRCPACCEQKESSKGASESVSETKKTKDFNRSDPSKVVRMALRSQKVLVDEGNIASNRAVDSLSKDGSTGKKRKKKHARQEKIIEASTEQVEDDKDDITPLKAAKESVTVSRTCKVCADNVTDFNESGENDEYCKSCKEKKERAASMSPLDKPLEAKDSVERREEEFSEKKLSPNDNTEVDIMKGSNDGLQVDRILGCRMMETKVSCVPVNEAGQPSGSELYRAEHAPFCNGNKFETSATNEPTDSMLEEDASEMDCETYTPENFHEDKFLAINQSNGASERKGELVNPLSSTEETCVIEEEKESSKVLEKVSLSGNCHEASGVPYTRPSDASTSLDCKSTKLKIDPVKELSILGLESQNVSDNHTNSKILVAESHLQEVKDITSENTGADADKSKLINEIDLSLSQKINPVMRVEGQEYEYLVKWVGKSHIHNEWISELQLRKLAKRKLENYKAKYGNLQINICQEKWSQAQRIIACRKRNHDVKEVLIKWCGLPYDECTWECIEESAIENLEQLLSHFEKFEHRALAVEDLFDVDADRRQRPAEIKTLMEQPKDLKGGTLFLHQLEALNWLRKCWHRRKNVILADEMGLGKTISACAFLSSIYEEFNVKFPCLVLVPLSTMPNWHAEFSLWAPHLNVVEYHGSAKARNVIRQYEWYAENSKRTGKNKRIYKFNVILTTYEMVIADPSHLRAVPWEILIVDEGHRLKNAGSKLFTLLNTFSFEQRVLLTGTPLQNNLGEMYNLLNFLQPDSFPSLSSFEEKFNDLTVAEKVEELKKLVAPHMLRRLKKDAMQNIPPKTERIVPIELTSVQAEYYRAVLTKNYQILRNVGKPGVQQSMMNVVMQLRKVCNHPYLISGIEPETGSTEFLQEMRIKASAKLTLLHSMLKILRKQGHRVLIFSQMTKLLDIMEDYLTLEFGPQTYERVDGSVSVANRQIAIARFNQDKSRFVFLLSTRACGLGINLASADTVIIYDSDFNPHADIQAMNRAHRIGQSKRLLVYRLVVRASVEERILQLAKKKLMLDHLFVNKSGSQKEIEDILRWGTEELFQDSAEPAVKNSERTGTAQPEIVNEAEPRQKKRVGGLGDLYEDKCHTDEYSKVVWDDAAIARLLDRSDINVGISETIDGDSETDMLGTLKEFVDDQEVANNIGETGATESQKKLEPNSNSTEENDWDRLLRTRWERYQSEEEAALGRGKRLRKTISYKDSLGQNPPEAHTESGNEENEECEPEYTPAGRALKTRLTKLRARQKERIAQRHEFDSLSLKPIPASGSGSADGASNQKQDEKDSNKDELLTLALSATKFYGKKSSTAAENSNPNFFVLYGNVPSKGHDDTDFVNQDGKGPLPKHESSNFSPSVECCDIRTPTLQSLSRKSSTKEQEMCNGSDSLSTDKLQLSKNLHINKVIPPETIATSQPGMGWKHFLETAPENLKNYNRSSKSNKMSVEESVERSKELVPFKTARDNLQSSASYQPSETLQKIILPNMDMDGKMSLKYGLSEFSVGVTSSSTKPGNNLNQKMKDTRNNSDVVFLPMTSDMPADQMGNRSNFLPGKNIYQCTDIDHHQSNAKEGSPAPCASSDDWNQLQAQSMKTARRQIFPTPATSSASTHDTSAIRPLWKEGVYYSQPAIPMRSSGHRFVSPLPETLHGRDGTKTSLCLNSHIDFMNINIPPCEDLSRYSYRMESSELWTEDELDALWIAVRRHGRGNWDAVMSDPKFKILKQRCAKELAERWESEQMRLIGGPFLPPIRPMRPENLLERVDVSSKIAPFENRFPNFNIDQGLGSKMGQGLDMPSPPGDLKRQRLNNFEGKCSVKWQDSNLMNRSTPPVPLFRDGSVSKTTSSLQDTSSIDLGTVGRASSRDQELQEIGERFPMCENMPGEPGSIHPAMVKPVSLISSTFQNGKSVKDFDNQPTYRDKYRSKGRKYGNRNIVNAEVNNERFEKESDNLAMQNLNDPLKFLKLPSFLDNSLNFLRDFQSGSSASFRKEGENSLSNSRFPEKPTSSGFLSAFDHQYENQITEKRNSRENLCYASPSFIHEEGASGNSVAGTRLPHWLREVFKVPSQSSETPVPSTTYPLTNAINLLYGDMKQILPPYTYPGPPPSAPRDPCRRHRKRRKHQHVQKNVEVAVSQQRPYTMLSDTGLASCGIQLPTMPLSWKEPKGFMPMTHLSSLSQSLQSDLFKIPSEPPRSFLSDVQQSCCMPLSTSLVTADSKRVQNSNYGYKPLNTLLPCTGLQKASLAETSSFLSSEHPHVNNLTKEQDKELQIPELLCPENSLKQDNCFDGIGEGSGRKIKKNSSKLEGSSFSISNTLTIKEVSDSERIDKVHSADSSSKTHSDPCRQTPRDHSIKREASSEETISDDCSSRKEL